MRGDRDFSSSNSLFWLILLILAAGFFATGFLGWHYGSRDYFAVGGLANASRTINKLMGAVLTAIALIVPLASNLYTPKLVKLIVQHPVTIFGLGIMILGNLVVLTANFFAPGHPWYPLALFVSVGFSYAIMAVALPYLYMISRFLRPMYFIPLLARRACATLQRNSRRGATRRQWVPVFETVDVLTNIALTALSRGDLRLVVMGLKFSYKIVESFIEMSDQERDRLREIEPFFVSGMTREGSGYLQQAGIWPEAYVFYQFVRVLRQSDRKQEVIWAEVGKLLLASLRRSVAQRRTDLFDLHIMTFNSLMQMAIAEKSLAIFQTLSYQYRIEVETLLDYPDELRACVQHHCHYGHQAAVGELGFGKETVLYDTGRMCVQLAGTHRDLARGVLEDIIMDFWRHAIEEQGHIESVCWRAVIMVYWELRAAGVDDIAELIRGKFLSDDFRHAQKLSIILASNQPLHWEINNRLLRFGYIRKAAAALASQFVDSLAAAK